MARRFSFLMQTSGLPIIALLGEIVLEIAKESAPLLENSFRSLVHDICRSMTYNLQVYNY